MKLSDIPTGIKVMIAPVVAISAFTLLGLMTFQLYATMESSNARLRVASTLQRDAIEVSGVFHKGLGSFYRAIGWTYAKVEQKLIDSEISHALQAIGEAGTSFGKADVASDTKAAALITTLGPKIKALRGSLEAVASALSADPFVASMLMSDVDLRVHQIEADLMDLSAAAAANMDAVRVETDAVAHEAVRSFLMLGGAAITVSLALAFFIGRMIARPIVRITNAMRELADGNLDVAVPNAKGRDEIGAMAAAMAVFKDNAQRVARLRQDREHDERQAALTRRAELDGLAQTFEASVKGVVGLVATSAKTMQRLSLELKDTATGSTEQALTVTKRAMESAGSVTSVANAAEELSSSIAEIAARTSQSATAARNAADRGHAAVAISKGLTGAAASIGEVVELIRSIAAQTNLLALNATIEAARAGTAGRGFAVVAQEVKQLATATTQATGEIEGQISSLQVTATNMLQSIELIGAEIADVHSHAESIAAAVEQQQAVVSEISRSASEVARSTRIVSEEIVAVGEGAKTTASAAQQSHEVSSELDHQARRLEADVASFLQTVRAA